MALPRVRRPWSDIRAEIRTILREDVAGYWTDAQLLTFANMSMDRYVMLLMAQDEAWMNDTFQTDLTAGEVKYALPEGAGQVHSVSLVPYAGQTTEMVVQLVRDERLGEAVSTKADPGFTITGGPRPTFRIVGNLIYLSLAPRETTTNGLQVELEFAPARLTTDGSKFDKRFPDVFETVVAWDVAATALAVESAQGSEQATAFSAPITRRRDELERLFLGVSQSRINSRTYGKRMSLGA